MSILTQSAACAFVRKYVAAKHALDELDAKKAELIPFVQENGTRNKSGKSMELCIAEHKAVVTPKTARPSYNKAWTALIAKHPEIAEDAAKILAECTTLAEEGYSVSIK